jgi:hypothetical protein
MPNRKTFDEREKYDHSGHPVDKRQPSDLKPDVKNDADAQHAPAARNSTIHLPRGKDPRIKQ